MTLSLREELRRLAPAWFFAVMLPAPAAFDGGQGSAAVAYFFLVSAILVADVFRRELGSNPEGSLPSLARWHVTMVSAGAALLAAWVLFALFGFPRTYPSNLISAMLGLLIVAATLCITPYLMLVTRNAYAAVVFTLTLVACMKMLGCVLVVLVYGWDASSHGHTMMPWLRPNLLVWLFYTATTILSATCYLLSIRRLGVQFQQKAIPGALA